MKIRSITTTKSYGKAVRRIGEIWDAQPGSPEANELEVLRKLIEDYEEIHYRPYPRDPIAAIELRMVELNLTRKDLECCISSENLVEDVLDRRCPLTLSMIRSLSERLRISERILALPYPLNLCGGEQRKRAVG